MSRFNWNRVSTFTAKIRKAYKCCLKLLHQSSQLLPCESDEISKIKLTHNTKNYFLLFFLLIFAVTHLSGSWQLSQVPSWNKAEPPLQQQKKWLQEQQTWNTQKNLHAIERKIRKEHQKWERKIKRKKQKDVFLNPNISR